MRACLQEQGCKHLESQECYYTRWEQYKLGLTIHSYLVVLVSTHNFNFCLTKLSVTEFAATMKYKCLNE